MKKNASSKILLSLGVATLLYSSAFAQEINLTGSSDIGKYFEENGKDINLKNPDDYKGKDLSIKMGFGIYQTMIMIALIIDLTLISVKTIL